MKKILATSLMLVFLTSFGQIVKTKNVYQELFGHTIERNIMTTVEGKQDTFYICSFRNARYQYIDDYISFSMDKKGMITFLDTCYKLLKNYPKKTSIFYQINNDRIVIKNSGSYLFISNIRGYFYLRRGQLERMLGVMRKEL